MSQPSDEQLREAFQALVDAPDSSECVPAEEIFDAVAGELPPERVAAIVDHLVACPVCAEAWRLAMLVPRAAAAPAQAPRAVIAGRSSWWPAVAGLALAAAAVFVVAPGILATPDDYEAPVYRDGAAAGLTTASPTVLVPRLEVLPSDVPLSWSGAPEGSTYEVSVTDGALREVVRAQGLTSPTWSLPAAHVMGLPPGEALLWRVEATTPTGERMTSPTWRIAWE